MNGQLHLKESKKRGSTCCWCGLYTFVGVEHIIPRSAGGPVLELWNLAWACYPCNDKRGSSIEPPPYDWLVQYRKGLGASPEPTGWLYKAFYQIAPAPTKEDLVNYFTKILL
ncbi:MAG: HNH endonuclease [bacterium]|nr:HNH endonuclease [bacterium]